MHIHFEGTAESVHKEIRAFMGFDNVVVTPSATKAVKAAIKEATASTEAKEPVKEAATVATVTAGAAAPITLDNVRDLVPLVAAKQGRPKAMELLAKYGAKKGNEVKEADWAAFITDAKALLA